MTTASAVEFNDVTLTLGDRVVLSDVSISISEGEFVGLLGPNGAGKTTLMRAILGLVPPSRGTISVLGRPATRGNVAVGYMPQVRAAPATMGLSGWDFVASVVNGHRLGLPLHGKADRAEIHRSLEMVDAHDLAHRRLGEMSGGERQRLLLAQALVGRPRLLLLDEPLISLDPHRGQEILTLVQRVQRELGVAVLFSAHELNQLLGVMDKVLYLGRGQAALGAVEDVVTAPVLSRLYGSQIDVMHVNGRIFVMVGGHDIEHQPHRHDHDGGDWHSAELEKARHV